MNKKGQFYIFIAVVLALVIFVVVSQVNTLEERVLLEDFNQLSKNYATEAPKTINKFLSTQSPTDPNYAANIQNNLGTFTYNFVKYAKTQDPNIGFLYVYKATIPGLTPIYYIANYLPSGTAGICSCSGGTCTSSQLPTCTALASSTDTSINNIKLDVGGQTFKQDVPTELKTFGLGTLPTTTLPTSIQISGISYDISSLGSSSKNLNIISTSSTPNKDTTSVSLTIT